MINDNLKWLKWVSEIQALAQTGLTYTTNEFDKERFMRLREIAAELTAELTRTPVPEIQNVFSFQKGYATPKIDVRSFILKDDKMLLVKEREDGLWTLPGGFADINESPSEAVIRETKEESGYEVTAIKLLAFWDKLKHDHPPQWPHMYKCIFHCEILSGQPTANLEISEVGFFDIDKLPPLSTPRVTASQLIRLYGLVHEKNQPTVFD